MKINYDYVKREIAGEVFLVPVGEAAKKYSGLIALNDVAAFIWDLLPEVETEEEIVSRILDEYEVEPEVAAADTAEFFDTLRKMEII